MADEKDSGLTCEFTAAYRMTRTYIMRLMLQLRMSTAVTLFILHSFMASAGDKFTFPFHLLRKGFVSSTSANLIKRFMFKVNPPKISPS